MKKHLAIWLAVIFAAFHFIIVGSVLLDVARGAQGEGPAFAVFFADFPLFLLSKIPIGGHVDYGPRIGTLIFLLAGTLMYALAGFILGVVINLIRGFIARWDER